MKEKAEIKFLNNSFSVYAKTYIAENEVIFRLSGRIINKPTMFSVQTDIDKHIELPDNCTAFSNHNLFWRFLNHSCQPNCRCHVDDLTVRACRNINPSEELTFNYNTTEYNMAAPFVCQCMADDCIGEVKGFKHLDEKQQTDILPFVARHIKVLYENKKTLEGDCLQQVLKK